MPTSHKLIKTWSHCDYKNLYYLARYIEDNELWRAYLLLVEHECFKKVLDIVADDLSKRKANNEIHNNLDGLEAWIKFLDGDFIVNVEKPEEEVVDISENDKAINNNNNEHTTTPNKPIPGITITTTNNANLNINSPTPSRTPSQTPIPTSSSLKNSQIENDLTRPQTSSLTIKISQTYSLDSMIVASRIRYMLYERSIDLLFPKNNNKNSSLLIENNEKITFNFEKKLKNDEKTSFLTNKNPDEIDYYNLLEFYDDDDDDDDDITHSNSNKNENHILTTKSNEEKIKVRDDDDDYEEEEDDDDAKTLSQESTTNSMTNSLNNDNDNNKDNENKLDKPLIISMTEIAPSPDDIKKNEDAAKRRFSKIYHTFEGDRETLLKRRKLEESDRQMNSESLDGDNNGNGNDNSKFGSINLGAANLSLKHLLGVIDEKRDDLGLTDVELKNLIMDVRKNRSKWVSFI